MSGWRWMLGAAPLAVSMAAFGGDSCGPGLPPCDEPHGAPGCLQPQCCEIVCESDPFCCEDSWDSLCVEIAVELCGGVECPEEGDCLVAHEEPGCIDETCCELVRLHDPFCGFGVWDVLCVEAAERWCGAETVCPIEAPPEAIEEGESCLERINEGCGREQGRIVARPFAPGTTIFGKIVTNTPRDVDWYDVPASEGDVVEVVLAGEFPSRAVVVSGDCEGPLRVLDRWSVDPCHQRTWTFEAPAGDWYLVVEAGIEGRVIRSGLPCDEIDPKDPPDPDAPPPRQEYGLRYLLTVNVPSACPGDLDGDGVVGGSDLGLLFVDWGACGGCPADLDGNGEVNGSDLGLLFVAWGDC